MKDNQLNLRFAVGAPSGLRSSIWRVKSHGSEIYVSVRSFMGIQKISLHKDRTCLFKPTSDHRQIMERAGVELPTSLSIAWRRPESKRDLVPAMLITFPTAGLTAKGDVPPKLITWLPSAPNGHAIKVGFFFVGQGVKMSVTSDAPFKILADAHLPNGELIVIIASIQPFDVDAYFHQFRDGPVAGKLRFLTNKREFSKFGSRRCIVWSDPPKEGTHEFVEVGVAIETPRGGRPR